MSRRTNGKLTVNEELFVKEYLIDLNVMQAAIRAGYDKNYAQKNSFELLKRPKIQEMIQKHMDERSKRTEITADRVLQNLADVAEIDIGDLYDESGNLKPIHSIPKHLRKCIQSIKVFDEFEGHGKDRIKIGEVVEVKFWDKMKANELLGKHLKLFTDKVEHSGKISLEDLVIGAQPPPKDK